MKRVLLSLTAAAAFALALAYRLRPKPVIDTVRVIAMNAKRPTTVTSATMLLALRSLLSVVSPL